MAAHLNLILVFVLTIYVLVSVRLMISGKTKTNIYSVLPLDMLGRDCYCRSTARMHTVYALIDSLVYLGDTLVFKAVLFHDRSVDFLVG